MKRRARKRGVSLVVVLVIISIIGSMTIILGKQFGFAKQAAMAGQHRQTAMQAAASAMMDYMRMFSNSFYDKHYENLIRPDLVLGKASVAYTPTANPLTHSVFLEAKGQFGTGAMVGSRDRFTGLVRFQSDLTRFAMYDVGTRMGYSLPNGVYEGAFYAKGTLGIDAPNQSWVGGDVVVTGNIDCNYNATIGGNLYLGGVKTGPGTLTVLGQTYSYAPMIDLPALDFNYYGTHYATKTTTGGWWRFNADATYQHCGQTSLSSCAGRWSTPVAIGPEGGIFYAERCNIGVFGTIARPVTVVASAATSNDPNQGNVFIPENIVYSGGATTATKDYSFAILAKNTLQVYNEPNVNVVVVGVLYSELGPTPPSMYLYLHGKGFDSWGTNLVGGYFMEAYAFANFHPDPALNAYPPPGLPERPLLVNWDVH